MSTENSAPWGAIWDALAGGDPGPAVAFFDQLFDNDFAFAAGGLLRDVAERMLEADELLGDKAAAQRFRETCQRFLEFCTDQAELAELMAEIRGMD